MRIQVDGVDYAPARPRKIGVAITTRNRRDAYSKSLAAWIKHLPIGVTLVVVDDASEVPVDVPIWATLIRFSENRGVAAAKNAGIAALMDAGCTDLFLADDDTYPLVDGWAEPYLSSPEPIACYMWGDPVYQDDDVLGYSWPHGCLVYAERSVIDRIGGWWGAGVWGGEDSDFLRRAHNAGLSRCEFQDVHHGRIFEALDEHGSVESSVSEDVRRVWRADLLEARKDSAEFVPYREHVATEASPVLSVLVPSVASRRDTFLPSILDQLYGQHEALSDVDRSRIEILTLVDAKGVSLGQKRNDMINLARGRYVVFVDDDDRLEDDYLVALLEAANSGADVITFHVSVSTDGGSPTVCKYGLEYEHNENIANEFHRIPNHICMVRRDLASRSPFPDKSFGEDSEYAARLRPLLLSEHKIDRVLYHYDYVPSQSETRVVNEAQSRIGNATRKPTADLVILSKADTAKLREMTQHTIDTARENAGRNPDPLVINVIVIEQTEGVRYRGATTVHMPGPFAYNKFMNNGARRGFAPWVVFANNDLEFEPDWLAELLAADHELVSPVNPGDDRQRGFTVNESGWTNGRHFCGWCFMMKRSLWEELHGLDEDFIFWCADDVVIEQARAVGVKPMLVSAARVKHLTSKTAGTSVPDELTWGMVRLFEDKYGVKKFENDSRYTAWKRANPR
ncbi:glycosyltransferase [Propionimicrobium sp. PCR01-08-3]|uniref:glycosyltransferase n=1 Tax=Propionimicrobium sp. PCR01-08-3 TaxID=3052086 RepID=UPI00255C3355|nr:glycosyltransferase [Propionimicrobium sp. PCR01-08-3]WIY84327.1 glycosyltransferase [Propionimicrobium sp. PCR01-08-3]